jgi:hypothetical protein
MTKIDFVFPAQAGIHSWRGTMRFAGWFPACAGMTIFKFWKIVVYSLINSLREKTIKMTKIKFCP